MLVKCTVPVYPVAMLPKVSFAVIVRLLLEPEVTGLGYALVTRSCDAVAGLTVIELVVAEVMELCVVSVAVIV